MPSTAGEVVGRERLIRACGCVCEFLHYATDPYRVQRRIKFLSKRCPPCGQKANAVHNLKTADGKVRRGQETKVIPSGAMLILRRGPGGRWAGRAELPGRPPVETTGGGALSVVHKLARKIAAARGVAVQGQVRD